VSAKQATPEPSAQEIAAILSPAERHGLHIIVRDGIADFELLETVPFLATWKLVHSTGDISGGFRWIAPTPLGRKVAAILEADHE